MHREHVIDFDHRSARYVGSWREIYDSLRDTCPAAYTEAHGGYWILTRYNHLAAAGRDDTLYSSYNDVENDHAAGGGVVIPPQAVRSGMIEQDPPVSTEMRRIIAPFFAPARIRALAPWFRQITSEAVDRFIEAGECDFVRDLATVVPLQFTFRLVGLEVKDVDLYRYAYHKQTYVPSDSPENCEVLRAFETIHQEILGAVEDRRQRPRDDDFLTTLCQASLVGKPLSDRTICEIAHVVLGGGIDTTTNFVSGALVLLEKHRDLRQQLIENPGLLTSATEEFLRYLSPVTGDARTIMADHEIGGCPVSAGDRIFLNWGAGNFDPARFDAPREIRLDRSPNPHLAFGTGSHRCIGMNFARSEFQIMLSEVLRRMPDYRIDLDRVVRYPNIGIINGIISAPATFTPGLRQACALNAAGEVA